MKSFFTKFHIDKTKTAKLFCLLFLIIAVMRLHTFFNDFYDRDELANITHAVYTVKNNGKMTWPYGPAANVYYYYSQKVFGYFNWRSLHIIAVLLIFATSVAIYSSVLKLTDKRTAFLSAFFYSLFMGIGFRDFYVLNAEIIFNIYISFAFMFFVFAEFNQGIKIYKRAGYLAVSLIFAFLAFKTKMHAKFFILLYGVYPFLRIKEMKKRLYFLFSAMLLALFVLIIDNAFFNAKITNYFLSLFKSALNYITSEKLSFSFVLTRLSFALVFLFVVQLSVWYLAFRQILNPVKSNLEPLKLNVIYSFFIISFVPALLTLRMFPHYFIQPLLPASILAGISLEHLIQNNRDSKLLKIVRYHIIIISALSILFYNGLLIAKNVKPDFKVHLQMFWQNKKLVETINYLNKNKLKKDKIFVYGDASSIYYFTKSLGTGGGYWLSVRMNRYLKLLNSNIKNKKQKALKGLKSMVKTLEKNNIRYFINTAPSGYSDFERFPLEKFLPLFNYVKNNYKQVHSANGITIYKNNNQP